MQEDKIYIVESHYGYFDNKKVVIDGIFSDKKEADNYAQEIRSRYKMIFRMKDPKENIENWKNLSFSDLVKLCEMREEFFESVKYNGTIVKGYNLPRHRFRIRL